MVALLVVVAIAAFCFAAIAGSDPEGRGGVLVLAGLIAAVVCVLGAVIIVTLV